MFHSLNLLKPFFIYQFPVHADKSGKCGLLSRKIRLYKPRLPELARIQSNWARIQATRGSQQLQKRLIC
jgi:hypothetical protein